ncbi:hypothetical protein P691DRAFT_674523 [Macrolepiota fuliginosa MF-IS2]|uniref:Uncharacterized protein n=1 Tax=Macrolepiota fuliginosa MF-IS2 TaxID=1400762 RepID=A0A9P6C246_9AGAR|nr:hypothetical protein P691DRAFT_674523 [Macrolepiota fuliginosa MF-IS2]
MSNTPQILLYESLDLISTTTVNGVLYGIALSVFILSAQLLYTRSKDLDHRRQAIFMLVYTSVVMALGIIYLALLTWTIQLGYIDNNNFLGEPIEYEAAMFGGQLIGVVQGSLNTIIDCLTLGIQLWRLWVIYLATQYAVIIMILPSLLFLGFIELFIDVKDVPPDFVFTMNIAFQLAFTVLVTLLVIARLLFIRRHHVRLMGASDTSKQYMGIAAMLIESYTLESVWNIGGLVSSTMPKNQAVIAFFNNCNIIACLLVIYRVSMGRAWNKQIGRQITRSLQFNHSNGHTTQSTGLGIATQVSQTYTGTNNPLPSAPLGT